MVICPSCGHSLDQQAAIKHDEFEIAAGGPVLFKGRPIQVRPSGIEILRMLAAANGRIVSNEVLLKSISVSANPQILAVQIKYLRYSLQHAGAPDVVRTHRMHGYSWQSPNSAETGEGTPPGLNSPNELSDAQWAALSAHMPPNRGRGRQRLDQRRALEGMLRILQTGSAWRELDETYGNWNSIYNCFRRWAVEGVWDDLMPVLVELSLTENWLRGNMTGYRSAVSSDGNEAVLRQLLLDRATEIKSHRPMKGTIRENWVARQSDPVDEHVPKA